MGESERSAGSEFADLWYAALDRPALAALSASQQTALGALRGSNERMEAQLAAGGAALAGASADVGAATKLLKSLQRELSAAHAQLRSMQAVLARKEGEAQQRAERAAALEVRLARCIDGSSYAHTREA